MALTLTLSKSETSVVATCTNLAGDELAVMEVAEQIGLCYVRDKVAQILDCPKEMIVLSLSGHASPLKEDDYSKPVSEFMATTDHSTHMKFIRAILHSETLFQRHCTQAFKKFDKNNDGVVDQRRQNRSSRIYVLHSS